MFLLFLCLEILDTYRLREEIPFPTILVCVLLKASVNKLDDYRSCEPNLGSNKEITAKNVK